MRLFSYVTQAASHAVEPQQTEEEPVPRPNPNPYSYRPLESESTVRILLIPPGTPSQPLSCNLVHVDRNAATQIIGGEDPSSFEAVSYTWGAPDFSVLLPVEDGCFLIISPTVDSMLRCFRHPTKTRRLWIDAICLNQADEDEKAVQVQLMGDIYRQAHKVRIWLGEPDSTIPQVWAILRAVAGRGVTPDAEAVAALINEVAGPSGTRYLRGFIQRPWFTRRWIIQEAAVSHARVVHCGRYKMSWDWMVDAFEVLLNGWEIDKSPFLGLTVEVAMWNAKTIRRRIPRMLELLWEFDKSECFDPRDRIFALLGLAEDVVADARVGQKPDVMPLQVTYKTPWADPYIQITRSKICCGQALEIFSHLSAFGSLSDQDETLPSWVPAWNRPRQSHDITSHPRGKCRDILHVDADSKTVSTSGWSSLQPIVKVSQPGEPMSAEKLKKLVFDFAITHFRRIESVLVLRKGGKHKEDIEFWHKVAEDLISMARGRLFFNEINVDKHAGQRKLSLEESLQTLAPRWHYTLFSAGRQIGICRNGVALEDVVAYHNDELDDMQENIYLGCVLRPDGPSYRFLGPCFVTRTSTLDLWPHMSDLWKKKDFGFNVSGHHTQKHLVLK